MIIIITLILAVIIVNTIVTRVIIVDLFVFEERLANLVRPNILRNAMRVCLIPPIGIAISAIAMVSVLTAMLIMMILEIWDR